MMWVFAILVVLAIGSVAVVAAGRGTPMQEEYDDRPDVFVPALHEPIGAGDLKAVRFSLAVRGYRMAEVDELLARLARQLEEAAGAPAPRALPAPDHRADADRGAGADHSADAGHSSVEHGADVTPRDAAAQEDPA